MLVGGVDQKPSGSLRSVGDEIEKIMHRLMVFDFKNLTYTYFYTYACQKKACMLKPFFLHRLLEFEHAPLTCTRRFYAFHNDLIAS